MANLGKVVYLTEQQKQTLFTNGTITVDGVTITYSANDIYVTPQDNPVTDVQVNGTSVVSNGVANVPVMGTNIFGVAKTTGGKGISVSSDGIIQTDSANTNHIKAGTNGYCPITPAKQKELIYYGLANLAGASMSSLTGETVGQYPSAQLTAIHEMLKIPDWKTIILSESDYDSELGMFVFDAGSGKEIKEARVIGQVEYDTAVSNPVIGVGFGNVSGRSSYNEFCSKTHSGSVNKIGMQVEGKNFIFENGAYTYRSQFGYGYYGANSNTSHSIHIDMPYNTAFTGRGTQMYSNFNDPRYLHITAPSSPSWAFFYIEYVLR